MPFSLFVKVNQSVHLKTCRKLLLQNIAAEQSRVMMEVDNPRLAAERSSSFSIFDFMLSILLACSRQFNEPSWLS
jgi:hypothetical protein